MLRNSLWWMKFGSVNPLEENSPPSTQPKMQGSRKQKKNRWSLVKPKVGTSKSMSTGAIYRKRCDVSTDQNRHHKILARLDMLARFLLGNDAQTNAFCAHLNMLKAIPSQAELQPKDMLIPDMRAYCCFRNIPIPEMFTFHPINSKVVLLHWRLLIHLIQQIQNQEEYEEVQQGPPVAIDSHCHLDRMVRGKVKKLEGASNYGRGSSAANNTYQETRCSCGRGWLRPNDTIFRVDKPTPTDGTHILLLLKPSQLLVLHFRTRDP